MLCSINLTVKIGGARGLHSTPGAPEWGGVGHFPPKPYSLESFLKPMRPILAEA
jgi:hypothetical protein